MIENQAGIFGNGCLRVKAVDIAGLGNDTGGVDLAMPGTEVSVLGMIWNCCSMALSNTLICFSRARMVAMETAIAWFTELCARFTHKDALVAFAGMDAPPFQSGTFDSKSRRISKRGSPHLRRTLFQIASIILQHSEPDNPVSRFMDKKRAAG